MKFCEILKELREEKQITQKELALKSGLSTQCISALEKEQRHPTGTTLSAIADFFNVSTDYLLGRTDELGSAIVSPTAPALSEKEREILRIYNGLNPAGQELIDQTLKTLSASSAHRTQTSKNA